MGAVTMESSPGNGGTETLRIAIVLDSLTPPAWISRVVASLLPDRSLQAALVLLDGLHAKPGPYLFERYAAWDRKRWDASLDPLAPVDVSAMVRGLPEAIMEPLDASTDLVLWLSDAPIPAAVPARLGIWYFSHGVAGCSAQRVAYFPELIQHQPLTSTYLLATNGTGQAPKLMAQSHAASAIGWSLGRQRTAPFWKAALLPAAALKSLRQGDAFQPVAEPGRRAVSNASVVRFAARNVARTVNRRLRYAGKEAHWYVAHRTRTEEFVANRGAFTTEGWKELPAPAGHFYADPFVLTWQGRTFVFVEDYLYAEARGVLAVMELLPDGTFTPAEEVLNRPYHLSYPFVFEHAGEVYMIPETLESRRIELYRAVEMPHRWELVKYLREDVEAVDTTLWIEDGVFYFFTNIAEAGLTPNDVLSLYMADSLTGEWRAHPANPLNLDVRAARGAGKLFRMGGQLVRPSQDCSVRYGYATQLNRVDLLNPAEYRETPIFRIEPDWAPNLIGTHTINSNEAIEVIDGQVYQKKYRRSAEG